jgi:hypothetical protein
MCSAMRWGHRLHWAVAAAAGASGVGMFAMNRAGRLPATQRAAATTGCPAACAYVLMCQQDACRGMVTIRRAHS